jgi:hypothetical protein
MDHFSILSSMVRFEWILERPELNFLVLGNGDSLQGPGAGMPRPFPSSLG